MAHFGVRWDHAICSCCSRLATLKTTPSIPQPSDLRLADISANAALMPAKPRTRFTFGLTRKPRDFRKSRMDTWSLKA